MSAELRSPPPASLPEGAASKTVQARERLYLYDTTLRDGQQTPGVDFSVEDKRVIAGLLDELGIDYIEGGYPGANPTDSEFFADPPALKAIFTAFGRSEAENSFTALLPSTSQS